MKIISEYRAKAAVTMPKALDAIERMFVAMEAGKTRLFPVAIGEGSVADSRFAIKSGLMSAPGLLGLKVGTYWPGNRNIGLANHGSTVLLLDDATGLPRALIAASYLTAMRTAAADGVAVRHLAREDASRVALVGAGHQPWFDLAAICAVRVIEHVAVWSRDEARAAAFAHRVVTELGIEASTPGLAAAVSTADIVVTATPSSKALVEADWIAPGTHISAMGADAPGKQELDVALVGRARLFADILTQSVTIGEFQEGVRQGVIDPASITMLGAVITGTRIGRSSSQDITIFDSSGIALQDLAIASLVIEAVGDDPKLEMEFL